MATISNRAPSTRSSLSDTTQKQFVDWAHIRFDAPEGHYFHRGLNKIKLDDLRELVERDYDIETWDELPSDKRNRRRPPDR